jgi:hypothetical protein
MVVAGILIHGDRSYRALEQKLRDLVIEEIPQSDRNDFVFHAKDIFHGNKYFERERGRLRRGLGKQMARRGYAQGQGCGYGGARAANPWASQV